MQNQNYRGMIRRCEQNFLRTKLEPFGLLPIEATVLRIVSHKKPCNQDTLCSSILVDKGRIAKIVARLEKLGMIRRVVNEQDRREKLVELTEQGERMLQKIYDIYRQWNQILFVGFTEQECAQYSAFLERIAQNACAYRREEREKW